MTEKIISLTKKIVVFQNLPISLSGTIVKVAISSLPFLEIPSDSNLVRSSRRILAIRSWSNPSDPTVHRWVRMDTIAFLRQENSSSERMEVSSRSASEPNPRNSGEMKYPSYSWLEIIPSFCHPEGTGESEYYEERGHPGVRSICSSYSVNFFSPK